MKPSEQSSSTSPPPVPRPLNPDLSSWIRWIIYGLFAAAAIYGFLRYRRQVIQFLRQLWQELLALLNEWFGRKQATAESAAESAPMAPPRPFAAFQNPFASGAASRMSCDHLVRYTFEALEAWAYEQGFARRADETPLEFAQSLGGRAPILAADARELAVLFARITYARATLSRDCLPLVERLWRRLQSEAMPVSI